MTTLAAGVFVVATLAVVLFELALASGAPWGEYAMGGATPGRLPRRMRLAAAVQAVLLAALAGIVAVRAGLVLPALEPAAGWLIWIVVGISFIALVLNTITRSTLERRIWMPVALVLAVSSLVVAVSGG